MGCILLMRLHTLFTVLFLFLIHLVSSEISPEEKQIRIKRHATPACNMHCLILSFMCWTIYAAIAGCCFAVICAFFDWEWFRNIVQKSKEHHINEKCYHNVLSTNWRKNPKKTRQREHMGGIWAELISEHEQVVWFACEFWFRVQCHGLNEAVNVILFLYFFYHLDAVRIKQIQGSWKWN